MNLVGVAARNILRNKARTALTVTGGVVAIVAFVMLQTLISAWNVAADFAAKDRLGTWNKVSFIMPLPKRYIDVVRAVPGVKAATWANWFGAKDPKNPDNFFATMAVDPTTFLEVYDEMVVPPDQKARWFEDRQGALVGDVLAKKLGVEIGDHITLTGTIYPGDWQFNISGIYTASRKSMDRSQFVFHWDYVNESIPERRKDQIGWVVSRVDDPQQGPAVSAAIDKIFDERDAQTSTMSERSMNKSFMATVSAVMTALDIVSIIILFIMMMILGNTIAMGVRERTSEYGVLRALGFSPGHVRVFIVGEALTIGVLAGVVGLLVSYPFVEHGVGRWLEENMGSYFPYFRVSAGTAVLGFLLPVALATVASLLPAYRASKLSVTDSLRRVA